MMRLRLPQAILSRRRPAAFGFGVFELEPAFDAVDHRGQAGKRIEEQESGSRDKATIDDDPAARELSAANVQSPDGETGRVAPDA
jgi:hypothetical protein